MSDGGGPADDDADAIREHQLKLQAAATKARAEKTKERGVGFVARSAILAGKTNAEALAEVMAAFPKCSSNTGCMGWYRNKLRKGGLLKKDNTPAAKAASAPEVAERPTKKAARG